MAESNLFIRIGSISIENFKSVVHGSLALESLHAMPSSASIMGIYGQNGSGKTAIINALAVLQTLLLGKPLEEKLYECINVNAETAKLTFELRFYRETDPDPIHDASVFYEVEIAREIKEKTIAEKDSSYLEEKAPRTEIRSEKLSIANYTDGSLKAFKKTLFVETSDLTKPFTPNSKYKQFFGNKTSTFVSLLAERTLADRECRSFIFSEVFSDSLFRFNSDTEKQTKGTESPTNVELLLSLLRKLKAFARRDFFVIDAAQSGFINLNTLPLRISSPEKPHVLFLPLNHSTKIRTSRVNVVKNVLNSLNVVLERIVPGLTIELAEIGREIDNTGNAVTCVQLVSKKENCQIPLQYESDGIKKIISILDLLICVYNRKSVVVAIDELDTGIFEYLLGELMRIISEHGQGQLVFTSHNLRPLETIHKSFIAFTTANSKDCYTQLKNIKETNNLRSMYFRNLLLNADEKTLLYRPTDNFDIARAFRKAGKDSEQRES